MIFLGALKRCKESKLGDYPFHMPVINELNHLNFDSPVTFFIGENGCGKTTLLESMVVLSRSINLVPEEFKSMTGSKALSLSFELEWHKKTSRGFYLKSQSFITYIQYIDRMKSETRQEVELLKEEYMDRSRYAYELATGPYLKTLGALTNRYGEGLDKMSHGEGYLELFKSRLVPEGLYILDEPELSLSPMRQLSLIALMKEMVAKDCQFIIITHSPILMAFEDAIIYEFSHDGIKEVEYGDVEHVTLTRDFLNNPKRYLRYL
ncbi:MAG: AAA family ATPase [Clostridiales bacterium]|nr:AAA family ATPase [Clostridiales bacterium]